MDGASGAGDADARSERHDAEPPCARSSIGQADPSLRSSREALGTLAAVRQDDPPGYQRTISQLKQAGVRLRDLERELRRASFRVIEGGPTSQRPTRRSRPGPTS